MEWIGLTSHKEIPVIYQKASFLILPSRLDLFPIAVLEAMASHLPVIASKVGGIPEIIENEKDGLLVEKENPKQLSKAIIKLLDNPNLAERMGANGRRKVENNYTWKKVAKEFEKEILSRL